MTSPAPIKPAEYLRRARQLEAGFDLPLRLAVVSTFTAELLRPFLIVEAHAIGIQLRLAFCPFGQLEQIILDPSTDVWQPKADVAWLALRLEDVDRSLIHDSVGIGPDATRDRLDAIVSRLVGLVRSLRTHHQGPVLVSNLAQDGRHSLNLFDANDPDGFVHLLAEANRRLARELAKIPGAHVFDYAGTVAAMGAQRWADPKLWFLARSVASSENMVALARRLARAVRAVTLPAAKCLVLDLDNTLWSGVLGDDGPDGIQLGDDYPGNVFKDFQAALLGLRRRGFLLAISSKNHESAVLAALDNHPEMLLRREHFAAIRADWEPKAVGLREIAKALNIGLDALVLVDDNPVERAAVRAELPQVQVIELPTDPLGYLPALADFAGLDQPRLLAEDRSRADMVQSDAQRQVAAAESVSLADFLVGLQMVARAGLADATTLDRIHQLIQKTNQFNLTTRRHGIEHLRRLMQQPDRAAVAWLRLQDRYGDLGLVCVGIVERLDEATWRIDTLLMSCRVMGRQVEDAFLSYLAEIARRGGARRLRGVYIPTAKNTPVAEFFASRGFKELGGGPEREYELELTPDALAWPTCITRAADHPATPTPAPPHPSPLTPQP